jgi:NAD(P)-dependent dehydrogenase (short-subunit alcohol dehydrogenase family)
MPLNPGAIMTERLINCIKGFFEQFLFPWKRLLGIIRFGLTWQIARALAFMVSPAASFCQGAILDVDGGETRTL